MDNEFPSNSREQKVVREAPGEKKVEKVIQGEAVVRKKSLGRRFKETFVGGDTKGVMEYVTLDVLIPAAKDMVADAMTQGVERVLFGESRPRGRSFSRTPGSSPFGSATSHVAYNRYSSSGAGHRPGPDPREFGISRRARASHDFGEIVLPTRVEAEFVIDSLFNLVSQYEMATVADLYNLVGQTPEFTDEKWGWTNLQGSAPRRTRGGYILSLPRPEPLD